MKARFFAMPGGCMLFACAMAFAGLLPRAALAQNAARESIGYLEHTEKDTQRAFPSKDASRYGVDINSSIDIRIDERKLKSSLVARSSTAEKERAELLQQQIDSLQWAVKNLKVTMERLDELIKIRKSGGTITDAQIRTSGNGLADMVEAIIAVREPRLKKLGQANDSDKMAQGKGPGGYDWPLIRDYLNEEIGYISSDIDALAADRFSLQIVPHLVSRNGQATPINLGGYNDAEIGARTRYQKLQFSSEAQSEAFKKYQALAEQVDSTKDLGTQVFQALKLQVKADLPALASLAQEAKKARDKLADRLSRLEQWSQPNHRKQWLQKVSAELAKTEEGKKVLDDWTGLDGTLTQIKSNIAVLRNFADMNDRIRGKTPDQVVDAWLSLPRLFDPGTGLQLFSKSAWSSHQAKLENFIKDVETLKEPAKGLLQAADSPVADLKATVEAFKELVEAVDQTASALKSLLDILFKSAPSVAATGLTIPAGTRAVAISASDMDTRIDLQTIPAARGIDDSVRVRYDLFDGTTNLNNGWTDELRLRSYGWNSEVLASLAFTRPTSRSSVWRATAAMNWILSYESWPTGQETGLKNSGMKWFSGGGLSMMPLNSSDDEGVKLGLALTLGFLNNRLLVGYGTNLQGGSGDKEFAFFSIRITDFPGLSGPMRDVEPKK